MPLCTSMSQQDDDVYSISAGLPSALPVQRFDKLLLVLVMFRVSEPGLLLGSSLLVVHPKVELRTPKGKSISICMVSWYTHMLHRAINITHDLSL